ncbi:MAG: acyltransferase [Lewinellaceae bacterium]|nr:acyltransferase [Saprospiraceae bacterium]MCB9338353.1 acyltransferase [Lewinellaceae bacterium]
MQQNTDPIYITRFLAAMSIVVHHFLPHTYRPAGGWENLTQNFNEGVNYFYILSGFVMVIAYQKAIFSGASSFPKVKYWIKRFARIYPVYLFALLATLSFHFFVKDTFTSVWERLPLEAAMLQTWVNFGSINSPAWSVSCEVFFYFLFPFFILKLGTLNGKKILDRAGLVYLLILVLTVFGFFANQYIQENPSKISGFLYGFIGYHPVLRVSTFIIGTLSGIWFLKNGPTMNKLKPYSPLILFASAAAILVIFASVPVAKGILFSYGIMVPLYFLLIISLCNLEGGLQKTLSHKSCIFLGDISYGIYILQVPVQMYFAYFIMPTTSLAGFLLYSLVLIVLSAISYIVLEKPMRKELTDVLLNIIPKKEKNLTTNIQTQ